jgi:hypothetical protein
LVNYGNVSRPKVPPFKLRDIIKNDTGPIEIYRGQESVVETDRILSSKRKSTVESLEEAKEEENSSTDAPVLMLETVQPQEKSSSIKNLTQRRQIDPVKNHVRVAQVQAARSIVTDSHTESELESTRMLSLSHPSQFTHFAKDSRIAILEKKELELKKK